MMAGSIPREFVRHNPPETFTATELMAEDLPPVK
jgi:hypothetical protein